MFFEESSPLSHIPVLRGIRPSMDIKRSVASHDEKNHRRSPRDPTTLLPKRQYGIRLDVDTFR
jgi:hypothetical protein